MSDLNPEFFNEQPHPEVSGCEFEIASEATKEELFALVEAVAKSGKKITLELEDEDIENLGYVKQLDTSIGRMLLHWDPPELPGDNDFLDFWRFRPAGDVMKTDYVKNERGIVVGAIDTNYNLGYSPDGLVLSKYVDEGFTPADEKYLLALLDTIRSGEPLSEDSIKAWQYAVEHADIESRDDYFSWAGAELEVGLNMVSEAEAKELIRVITYG